jgi:fructan beta-fructosidase
MRREDYYAETFRPQFHFSPNSGWMNDPNGLVYYYGEYHLFYQHISNIIEPSGHLHWGHAVSSDLVHWQHLPVALFPDHLGDIWSGSAIVDWNNSSGFQTSNEKVIVSIFTQVKDGIQQQSIAFSNDRGRTWTMYLGNPIIPNPGLQDFRDPKVFWHEKSQSWIMVLAGGNRIIIYKSANLKEWVFASEFGEQDGSHEGKWECPDMFELVVDGDIDSTSWVLLVSVLDGSPNGGSGIQYFLGNFDGKKFTNSSPAVSVHWVDYGKDNYAGVTFSDALREDGRRIFLGWMNNWSYARDVPTFPWKGSLIIPRQLNLQESDSGELQLMFSPIVELQAIRKRSICLTDLIIPDSAEFLLEENFVGGAYEIIVEYQLGTASEFGLIVRNELNDRTVVGYNIETQKMFVDRRDSGVIDFSNCFSVDVQSAPLLSESNILKLHVFVDWSSIEVFADDGRVVMTNLIFPQSKYNRLKFFARGGDVQVRCCQVWEMGTVWKE